MSMIRNFVAKALWRNGTADDAKKKPKSAFGGYRKRTMTARQLVGGMASLVTSWVRGTQLMLPLLYLGAPRVGPHARRPG